MEAVEIGFSVSAEGIKKSLGDMFSGAGSVITEAGQNACRAGASTFCIDTDESENTITLSNDGNILEEIDWLRLFRAGESGWNESIMTSQNPFGIGCTSMIFCSTKIVIHSGFSYCEIDCEEFLSGLKVAPLSTDEYVAGTIFTLHLKQDYWGHMGLSDIRYLFDGFPIDVYFNGNAIRRPLALSANNTDSITFEYGEIVVPSCLDSPLYLSDSHIFREHLSYFAQGLRVLSGYEKDKYSKGDFGIHLDITKVRPSAPDRKRIVNPPKDLSVTAISAIKGYLLSRIDHEVDKSSWFEVSKKRFNLINQLDRSLFGRPDSAVPTKILRQYAVLMYRLDEESDLEGLLECFVGKTEFVCAKDVPAGAIIFDDDLIMDSHAEQRTWHNYAADQGLPVIFPDLQEFPIYASHSVMEKGIDTTDQRFRVWTIEAENPSPQFTVEHWALSYDVVLFDSIIVTPPIAYTNAGEKVIFEPATYSDTEFFFANGVLYVGRKCRTIQPQISQDYDFPKESTEFSDFYKRDEEAESECCTTLMQQIRLMRGDCATDVIKEVLNQSRRIIKALSRLPSQSYMVSISVDGEISVTISNPVPE